MTNDIAAQAEATFQQAVDLHKQSRLDEARILYEEMLQLQPQHLFTWHLLGVLALQTNQPERALELIDKAILMDPQIAEFHNSHGTALVLLNRHEAAIASYDAAIALKSDLVDAYFNRGNAFHYTKRYEAALASYDEAIALRSDYADAYCNRGLTLASLRRFEAALASYDQAIAIRPDFALVHSNRGLVLKELQQLDAALASYDRAIAIKGDFAEAYSNRGLVLQDFHHLHAALASFDQAIAINANFAVAYFNRAMALLMAGDFIGGWIDYEWRWKGEGGPLIKSHRGFAQPCWLGKESICGKTILLHSEQGLGDTLQFCRYAKLVANLGARVILEVQRPLHRLLASVEGVAQVVAQGDALPAFDFYCPLMSLPLAFKTTLFTVPAQIPYLTSDAQKALHWKEKLGAKAKLRVGLVWSGGFRPHQPELWSINDRRNIPLATLSSLKDPDIEFYSLQKGQPAESELADLIAKNWGGPQLTDFTNMLYDFSDTAALIEQLDLIISVDTSVAHLAGALGKPVWIMIRFDTCWRWLLDRTDSPWYPTVSLYRQESAGDWDGVVQRVRVDLTKLVTGGTR